MQRSFVIAGKLHIDVVKALQLTIVSHLNGGVGGMERCLRFFNLYSYDVSIIS